MINTVPPATSPRKLMMVTAGNNNKFYNMFPQGDSLVVEWGRVGATPQKTTYPISKWNSLYRSKVNKGYKDITDLVKENTTKSDYLAIGDSRIESLFDKLLSFARDSVKQNYTISSDAVTQAQISEAQVYIDSLTNLVSNGAVIDIDKFNKLLLELYTVIPRRMTNVRDHLIKNTRDYRKLLQDARNIIDSEQKTLDVMRGQVSMKGIQDTSDVSDKTILDVLGIEVEYGSADDFDVVKRLMGSDAHELKHVYRVIHHKSRNRFDEQIKNAQNKKTELFWHGSRNENWISILQSGLKIRPSNAILTGAMFGHGIYFADKYRKSAGYTSLSGAYWTRGESKTAFIALMDVHVGNQYRVLRHSYECYKFTKAYLQQKGNYDSVFAERGADLRNNEYIVYDDAQCTIKYLVEIGK